MEERKGELLEDEIEDDIVEESEENTDEAIDETADTLVTEEDKKLFKKKVGKADKKQDILKEKVGELEDKVKRQMAEFENFRKRTEKEKSFMFETGAKSVIEKILPMIDNFERGLATVPEEDKNAPFAEGMNLVYKQLMTELSSIGVEAIVAVGEEFNPERHNAVMQVESAEFESGMIAQEMQKGYMYRDSVIRYSMVAVVI